MTCGPNIDPGGPRVGRYTLVADLPAMQTQFAEITSSTRQQICPGTSSRPGLEAQRHTRSGGRPALLRTPWRRDTHHRLDG